MLLLLLIPGNDAKAAATIAPSAAPEFRAGDCQEKAAEEDDDRNQC